MAHAQKSDFVCPRNGGVHVPRRVRQFSWLLAAEVRGSARSVCAVLERLCSAVLLGCWVPTPIHLAPSLPVPCVTVCHVILIVLYSGLFSKIHALYVQDDSSNVVQRIT
jgi:hypothetical protein